MPAAIKVEDLRVSYDNLEVLRGVSFEIPLGQGVVLLGANGCGKSTLMRSLNGLVKRDSGSIQILGRTLPVTSCRALRDIRRDMGYV